MIYVEGGTKTQQKLAKDLYYFCSTELDIKKKVDIDLRILDLEKAQAWTDHEGKGKFYLDIEQDLDEDQFITAFCHEMIHVIQHLRTKQVSENEAYKFEKILFDKFKQNRVNG
ncbi:MAG TPA: hypothetical protein DCX64_07030 [Gammaproteobacteria bacterium]|jgi:hypothetical protein|nr:hypothetical protein [Gammaproteobacteria bacterium]HAY42017.1 hypothetical protein [Gammaproteobacteria bacterium]|tara:strand:- start:960 stop:1298 length:339 start_codon:yes stop_codon:yes gene_type:complete